MLSKIPQVLDFLCLIPQSSPYLGSQITKNTNKRKFKKMLSLEASQRNYIEPPVAILKKHLNVSPKTIQYYAFDFSTMVFVLLVQTLATSTLWMCKKFHFHIIHLLLEEMTVFPWMIWQRAKIKWHFNIDTIALSHDQFPQGQKPSSENFKGKNYKLNKKMDSSLNNPASFQGSVFKS